MREIASDPHHHHHHHHHHHLSSSGDKKMHNQHGSSSGHHRRNPSSSSSNSSSSTSSSTSSSSSSSSSTSSHQHPHPARCGSKRDGSSSGKRKSRPSKRGGVPSSASGADRAKMKKAKSSSSSRKHSSSKSSKKGHPSKKEHDKLRGHKSSRSPTRRKSSMAKKLLSPVRKRSPSPPSSRKSHKLSPGRSKRSKSRKRSGSPRDRLDYRSERVSLGDRTLGHARDPTLASHAGPSSSSSSRVARDPRVDDRVRRVSPDQLTRDRYRYEKERVEEYGDARRERRSSPAVSGSRSREGDRKDSHRHRDYDRHEREHYEERRREDVRREEREREQLRERELRERELLRDRELMKERERVELMEREQERERERLREVEERRSRYGREHEFVREREVVLRGATSTRDYQEERDYYTTATTAARVRQDIDPRALALDDRRPYDDAAYERFQSERERVRYESSRSRYDELALHDRRGLPPLDDCRPPPPLDARFSDNRRRGSSAVDPRVHEAWVESERDLDRLVERTDHYSSHTPHPLALPRHRHHQPQWTSTRAAPQPAWDRHKLSRHEEWGEEFGRVSSSARGREWAEDGHDWGDDRTGPSSSLHQDQWAQHSRRSYRDEWSARERESEWLDPYSSRDLLPTHTSSSSASHHHHSVGRGDRSQQPPLPSSSSSTSLGRRSRREPLDPGLDPPPHHHHHHHHHHQPSRHQLGGSNEEDGVEGGMVGGGEVTSPLPSEQDQALMPGNDGELWEYDPGKGSWVRRAAETSNTPIAPTTALLPPPESRDSPVKKDKPPPPDNIAHEEVSPVITEDKKRVAVEEPGVEEPEAKRVRVESPTLPTAVEPEPPLQEKDTFSDISDDADDILNQEVGGFNDEESRNPSTSQIEADPRNLSRDNGPPYDDLLDEEEEIHFEEISDDELEEDRQAKFNVAGALDINWAVLVRNSAKTPAANEVAAGTALKRFQAPHLLARLGVSSRFARPEVVEKIKSICDAATATEEDTNAQPNNDCKKLEVCEVVCSKGVWRLVQVEGQEGQRVLDSVGPNRKALCARRDILLRRRLCNLPSQDLLGDNPLLDKDLFRQSVALLKSA